MIDEKKLVDELNEWSNLDKEMNELVLLGIDTFKRMINKQPKVDKWIPCSERLPDEHASIFAKFRSTDKWNSAMFEKVSDDVNVTIEYEDGTRKTATSHTLDGKWKIEMKRKTFSCKVIAWQPLPEKYEVKENGTYKEKD